MLCWDIYEITSDAHSLHGVMLRGCIRKFALVNEIDLLVENTKEIENAVRFAILTGKKIDEIKKYLGNILPNFKVDLVLEKIKNPVLSKMKVNQEERYSL